MLPSVSEIEELARSLISRGPNRRRFLQMAAAAPLLTLPRSVRAASHFRVGAGVGPNPYEMAVRAIDASGEFPNVTGRVVVIKPNLVIDQPPETGGATDPEVVRAVVDRCLAQGASLVLIVETSFVGAYWQNTGYEFFESYDIQQRVHLIDLSDLNIGLASIPAGWIYQQIYTPLLTSSPNIIFINVAKLKAHLESRVTLTAKNLFGLPHVHSYLSPRFPGTRYAMHDRGVPQTVYDLNLMRRSDFCLIDGIWGMEGAGAPLSGDPIRMNTVLAGRNSLAIDRVAMEVMQVPQYAVRYLNYISLAGLGPASLNHIEVLGDALVTHPFAIPPQPPEFDPPRATPTQFNPSQGQQTTVRMRVYRECLRAVEVVRVDDAAPEMEHVRDLEPFVEIPAGTHYTNWDGRDDDGTIVPPGRYGIRMAAHNLDFSSPLASAIGWVAVLA